MKAGADVCFYEKIRHRDAVTYFLEQGTGAKTQHNYYASDMFVDFNYWIIVYFHFLK